MKKILVAMAAVLAMTVSINAQDNKAACLQDAQCADRQQCQGDKQCPEAICPFDGLNLTEAQKTQIQELCNSCAQQQKAGKQQNKAAKKAARQECKKQMLAQLKTILTPEQYLQFLENSFVNAAQQQPKAAKQGKKGQRQGQRPQGQRPQRGQQPAPQQ